MFRSITFAALTTATLLAGLHGASAALTGNGGGENGRSMQGTSLQGRSTQGVSTQGSATTDITVLNIELPRGE